MSFRNIYHIENLTSVNKEDAYICKFVSFRDKQKEKLEPSFNDFFRVVPSVEALYWDAEPSKAVSEMQ